MQYLFRSGTVTLFFVALGLGACAQSEGYVGIEANGSGGTPAPAGPQVTSSGGSQASGSSGQQVTGSAGSTAKGTGGTTATGTGGTQTTGSGGRQVTGSGGATATGLAGATAMGSGGQTSGAGGVVGSGGAPTGGGGNQVSRDSNGWTVVTPSSDSRVIYVSSSQGKDSNDGLSEATARKTLTAATALLRPGYPDHLLLKSGDVWHETMGVYKSIGGRSAAEPMLISSYGTGARPSVRPVSATATNALFGHVTSSVSPHLYMTGIEFYDSFRDPSSPDYNSSSVEVAGYSWIDGGNDLLIEDCYFHSLATAIIIQYNTGPSPQNVTIRRNVITDQYSPMSHGQGIYLSGLQGTSLVEENILDHNAWKDSAFTVADVFNHHIYIADSINITVQNNLFLRCSSLSLKYVYYGAVSGITAITGMVAYNNFFYQGEVGISMAATDGISCYATGCILNPSVTYNVMSQVNQSTPTGRPIGWGMEWKDTRGGTASNNLMTDFSYTSNAFGIVMDDDVSNAGSGNNTISQNLFYKIKGPGVSMTPVTGWSLSRIQNNTIVDPSLGAPLVDQEGSFSTSAWSGNTYSPVSTSSLGTVSGATVSYATWMKDTGETGSSISTPSYPSPTNNLSSYAVNSLGMSGGIAQYLAAIRTVSKANYHPEYLAPAINNYMRTGFGLPAAP
jgi:hypothetical protein